MKETDNRIFYEMVRERIQYLNKIIIKTSNSLKNAPEGNILISSCKNNSQFFYYDKEVKKKGKYISKKNKDLIKKLVQKKYDGKILKIALKEQKLLMNLTNSTATNPYEDIYNKIHVGCDMVTPLMVTDEECIAKWYDCQYEKMGFAENAPEYYSKKGERMRSKSETVIADHLDKEGVPYLYECPIEIDGRIFHPDFKILNVHKREIIYWEHFGIMDDNDYMNKAIKKINTYAQNGLILGENLIVTFESIRTPLDYKTVDLQIKKYCL